METLKTLLPTIVSVGVGALVLSLGMDADAQDLLHLVRRPTKLFKAFLSISIVVPIVAMAVVQVLPLRPPARIGLLAMAIAPLPPFLPVKALKVSPDRSYVYGLYAVFSLLTVVLVPVAVALLARIYRADVSLSPLVMARSVFVSMLAPLVAGMVMRARFPALAERVGPLVSKLSTLLLLLILALILGASYPAMLAATGDGVLLAIAVIGAAAIASGLLLGGPDPHERAVLAAASATRHPGVALLIMRANDLDQRMLAVVLLFVLVTAIEFGLCQAWRRRAVQGRASRLGEQRG